VPDRQYQFPGSQPIERSEPDGGKAVCLDPQSGQAGTRIDAFDMRRQSSSVVQHDFEGLPPGDVRVGKAQSVRVCDGTRSGTFHPERICTMLACIEAAAADGSPCRADGKPACPGA
jgi:hypothetical protein